MRDLNLVVLGPPGVGKGTQAANLSRYFRVPHVSTGELLRQEAAASSEVGKAAREYVARGELVPDELVLRLVRHRLAEPDAGSGFVLDGYPRTLAQARALDGLLAELGRSLTLALALQAPDDVLLDRLAGRLVCPDCGATFHVRYDPPRPGEVCPACRTTIHLTPGGRLQCEACGRPIGQRTDDRPEVVRVRLAEYHHDVGPVLEHYRSQGLLREVDAAVGVDEVFERILRPLGEPVPTMPPQPPKRPVQEREGLRFGIDVDGTILQAPRHFKRLIDALLTNGNQVYIVTGRWERLRRETEGLLTSLGIRYSELVMRPDDWLGTLADFKVRAVQEKQLHLTIDDDETNCWAIAEQTEALAAHMLPFTETVEQEEPGAKPGARGQRRQGPMQSLEAATGTGCEDQWPRRGSPGSSTWR